ncbi:5-(carboxyamino)imidazole ribonucleotide synthase [Reinekea blandensis]|uniref:N5-carboxyaminoimidazole ribonucleotide synthase n=1 Tax=Reinekea blandensis MED297 TaxID=314283 RepID=A4BD68_9GAMM|nr:5-(carboxyamino)imidazole ribonucleotide synthase [Reinekea blandensis]EAR09812.1 phosphoribosylaminoimidazole carboxylase [Reinekea sp. MED297] [Reinekea blandensis MED297]
MKLGIVGGGQLGRMMAQAASPLGVKTILMDPADDACAGDVGQLITAAFDDSTAAGELARSVDAVTFEFENVPPETVEALSEQKPVYPPAEALRVARDRWHEKSLFQSLGIRTPPLALVDDQDSLEAGAERVGFPCVLKTRTLGYDGKGQKVLRSRADLVGTFDELGSVPMILEGFIDFEFEISCIGVRSQTGQSVFYPVVVNEHRQGMLYRSEPMPLSPLQTVAENAVKAVMDALDYVGTMAFEFFVRGDELIANEIAPRVHNSGHWTIEGARCSQFENHVRAVLGLPLGATDLVGPVVMYNIIGQRPPIADILKVPGVHWHDYTKAERPGRKIAHLTISAKTSEQLEIRAKRVEELLVNDLG